MSLIAGPTLWAERVTDEASTSERGGEHANPVQLARFRGDAPMKHLRWIGLLPLLLMLLQTCCSDFANAQSAAAVADNATNSAKNASELIGKLDQLVEQNRRLEKQNQELMAEINSLRQFLPKQLWLVQACRSHGTQRWVVFGQRERPSACFEGVHIALEQRVRGRFASAGRGR